MRAQLRFVRRSPGTSHLMSAQLGFCMPGHPGTPENRRNRPREFLRVLPATWPIALRDGITEWAQFFQGGGRPELRGRRGTFWWYRRGIVFIYAVGVRCLRCCRALPGPCQRSVDFQVYVFTLTPQGLEGRWQWSSVVAVLGTAQHAQLASLTAFLDS